MQRVLQQKHAEHRLYGIEPLYKVACSVHKCHGSLDQRSTSGVCCLQPEITCGQISSWPNVVCVNLASVFGATTELRICLFKSFLMYRSRARRMAFGISYHKPSMVSDSGKVWTTSAQTFECVKVQRSHRHAMYLKEIEQTSTCLGLLGLTAAI